MLFDKNTATLVQIADEALRQSGSSEQTLSEIRLYDYRELLIDYCPLIADSTERYGEAILATARVWHEGRVGFASGNMVDSRDLEILLDAARKAVPASPVSQPPAHAPIEIAGQSVSKDFSGERLREQARALAETLAYARGGKIQTLLMKQTEGQVILANSAGLRVVEHQEAEEALLRCETASGAIVDGMLQPSVDEALDTTPLAARLTEAFEAVAEEGDPADVHLPMVFRPAAAAPLVSGLAWLLRGDTAARTPGLAGARGRKIFPSHLTVSDDPRHPLGTRRRHYDDEGQPASRLSLIEHGRVLDFLHSTQSASALACQSNGRGFTTTTGRLAPPAPLALNLCVHPAHSPLPESYLELTTKLETLKTMPRAGLITMAVAGWIVRGGERTRRIRPFDLHLPLLPTWRRLSGVGDDLCFFSCADGCGTPSLLFPPLLSGGVL